MTDKSPSVSFDGNILIIEDDVSTAEMMLIILAHSGYGVRKVTSREAGLVALRRNIYHRIVMDLHMPGMNAEEFVAVATKDFPRSKILLVTASVDAATEAQRLGIRNYLGKPFNDEQLLNAIKTCL
jgi:CheY-like chemotaxis protein